MTNNSIDNTFDENEAIIEIDLVNRNTGATYPLARVYGENTLGQILDEYAEDIGVNKDYRFVSFENKRTGYATRDRNETVERCGLKQGDLLVISDFL